MKKSNHNNLLEVQNLTVELDGKTILNSIDLVVPAGKITAIMGPNGSGKSTLSHVIMGDPRYAVKKGSIFFQGKDIASFSSWQRAKLGIFLSFQNPVEVSGVNFYEFLLTIYNEKHEKNATQEDFDARLHQGTQLLGIDESFLQRNLNENFSGGEKKRAEMLQMYMLEPQLAVLDEIDSGLDIDALKTIAQGAKKLLSETTPHMGMLLITHYQRLLNLLQPDFVHVLIDGEIRASGGTELVALLEHDGYKSFLKPHE